MTIDELFMIELKRAKAYWQLDDKERLENSLSRCHTIKDIRIDKTKCLIKCKIMEILTDEEKVIARQRLNEIREKAHKGEILTETEVHDLTMLTMWLGLGD